VTDHRRFQRLTRLNRGARDAWLLGCALFLLFGPVPESLEQLGITGGAADLWVAGLAVGALTSLTGVVRTAPRLEIYGCMFAGFAMLVWALGAVLQPHATAISYALGCYFMAGVHGQIYRALYIAEQGGAIR
jgi:hypothetical protein